MGDVREEIEDARQRLGLSIEQLFEVPEGEARSLTTAFLARFTGGVDSRWWWERFTLPTAAHRYVDGKGFTRIRALVPDAQERVWFVAEDDQLPYFPVYDATPEVVQQLIGECYGLEYYLIAKDLSWLLCENHHDLVIAVGTVRPRLDESRAPGPKTQALIEILERLASLLRHHDEDDWASWLETDRDRLERGDFYGVEHFLSASGGMGSLNDVILGSTSGLALPLVESDRVTATLRALLSQGCDLARAISREAFFEDR